MLLVWEDKNTFEELLKARLYGSHTINQKPKVELKGKRENKNRYVRLASCYYFLQIIFTSNLYWLTMVIFSGQWISVPKSQLIDLAKSFRLLKRLIMLKLSLYF